MNALQASLGRNGRFLVVAVVLLGAAAWSFAVQPDKEPAKAEPAKPVEKGTIQIGMDGKPWKEVLAWLADKADLPLAVSESYPKGTFTLVGPKDKKYTLSDQTKKVVGDLKSNVTINYFDRSTNFSRAKDLLDRYANLSGKLKVNYIDPDKKPDQARMAGIKSYGSIVVENGMKKEEAKSLSEEEVTGALIRTVKTVVNTACFATGSGSTALQFGR